MVGEEDGGLGAFGTLARGHTGEACIITEPTGGTLITANGGALTFRITVPGAATHGSTRYAGVSAIDNYLPLHRALAELERRRNAVADPLMAEYPIAYPLSVGVIRAGDWASTVPDRLIAEGRLGVALDEDPATARAELEQAIARAARTTHGCPITLRALNGRAASSPAGDSNPEIRCGTACHVPGWTPVEADHGSAAPPTAATCGCTRAAAFRPCISAPGTSASRTAARNPCRSRRRCWLPGR